MVSYDFEQSTGEYDWEELSFTGVVALTFTAADTAPEQVGAFLGSNWIVGIVDPPPGLHHYRIYFDDVGCYEVLATAFVPPPET